MSDRKQLEAELKKLKASSKNTKGREKQLEAKLAKK